MAYASQIDLEKRGLTQTDLQQLADDDELTLTPEDIVTAAIADADALIDGYLGKRYTVPFDPVPALITKLSADLAAYNLYSHRPQVETPRPVEDRYRDALGMIKMLVSGEMTLDSPLAGETGLGNAKTVGAGRLYSLDTLENF